MLSQIVPYLLSLPLVLLALSVHETAHGFVADKLGDPTAKNLGRLTLNPLKHIDIVGFLCMILLHFGWAKPVPVNTRYFKNPRRDMALTAAAGPLSNIFLSFLFAGLLRIDLFVFRKLFFVDHGSMPVIYQPSTGFIVMCVLTYMLYIGVLLNISLAVFNLIPIPPFDGSRIAHMFLPQKWYFAIMRYEQYIMIAVLLLFWFTPFLRSLISSATSSLTGIVTSLFGISSGTVAFNDMWNAITYVLFKIV